MSKSPTAERSNLGQVTYYNQILDKKGTKKILSWFLDQYGPTRTSQFLEELKSVGFHFATLAGISLGFDDLKIPQKKIPLLQTAEQQIQACEQRFQQGKLTAVERYQKVITLWTTASENLKDEVIHSFQSTDLFNPLYMMAFSGARGNISQVRQLVGMRGLMSDSGGGIIDFPIRRNFREGLTVTEYAISCYGARKGLIDTALRTADSGYLTRRLVDVAHGIMIGRIECGTDEGFEIAPLRVSKAETGFGKSGVLLSLEKRILGRVLAQDVCLSETELAKKNQEITPVLAHMICAKRSTDPCPAKLGLLGMAQHSLLIRSPLTCKHFQNFREDICQLCYGWSLSQGRLVSLGEAVGILAAQSIGEPGTQLTMRTFHTGGIFSTDVDAKIFAPHAGRVFYGSRCVKYPAELDHVDGKADAVVPAKLIHKGKKIRTLDGETGFFLFEPLQLKIQALGSEKSAELTESIFFLPAQSIVFVYPGQKVKKNTLCAEISYFQQSDPSAVRTESKFAQTQVSTNEIGNVLTQFTLDTKQQAILEPDESTALASTQLTLETKLGATRSMRSANSVGAELTSTQGFISELDIFLDSEASEDEKQFPRGPSIREQVPENEGENLSELASAELASAELSDTIQTKKVLSDIEGQIYFSHRQASSLWVLSGSKTQSRGPVQTGDFFSSQSKSILYPSAKLRDMTELMMVNFVDRSAEHAKLVLLKPQQKQNFSSHEFTGLRKIVPWSMNFAEINQNSPLSASMKLTPSCNQRSELHQHGQGPSVNAVDDKLTSWWIFSVSNKEFQENSEQNLTQPPGSSIFLFSDSNRESEDSKPALASTQLTLKLTQLWSNFLCFSQRKGFQTSKNRFRAQKNFKIQPPHEFQWCKQEKLKIFQKRFAAIPPTSWAKLPKNGTGHKNTKTFDPSQLTQVTAEHQKRKYFGEFRSRHAPQGPEFENSWSQTFDDGGRSGSLSIAEGVTLEKNHLRKIQNAVKQFSSPISLVQIGQFLPATKNFRSTADEDQVPSSAGPALRMTTKLHNEVDLSQNLDTSVHLVMEASSKYCKTASTNVNSTEGSAKLRTDPSAGFQTFRRVHPYLISKHSHIHVHDGEIVSSRQLLFELFFEQSKTGDIVQGLPKIEQLFEARRTSLHVQETIHKKLKQKYLELSKLHTCFEATFQSIRYIQRILIDEIQTVYQSQGVDIADKHLEIIVRQMTSKVVLHETKHTSFFPGDVVDFYKLTHLAQGRDSPMPASTCSSSVSSEAGSGYLTHGMPSRPSFAGHGSNKVDIMASEIMEPFVLGITKVAFLTESFISAASFQEAKRVLMDAALESRVDFLYGLKENVIVGRFIRAGTGFQVDVFPSSTQPK
jgi:hypothetical protein